MESIQSQLTSLQSFFEKRHSGELILSGLFIIYLIMGFQTPEPLANIIDSAIGKIIVVLCALMLFAYGNPVLAILGVFVAYKLIASSSTTTGLGALDMFASTEDRKWQQFSPIHKFPYTLEQEVVSKMAPIVRSDLVNTKQTFKPVLVDLHDASSISE
jgi:hypothetical protein